MNKLAPQLSLSSATALLQAVSRAAIAEDPRRRVLVALSGICAVMNADMVTAAESHIDPATGETHFQEMLLCGDIEDSRKNEVINYLAQSHDSDPMYAAFGLAVAQQAQADPNIQLAIHRRQDLVPDDQWYDTEHYRTTRTKVGVDSAIYAGLRTRVPNVWVGAGFHRRQGRPQFDAADVHLASCFLLGARPLFDSFASTNKGAGPFLSQLTLRQREVTYALLEGLTAKEIASRLGLSEQSAETYCKRLYRRLEVSGRGELVRLCNQKGVILGV